MNEAAPRGPSIIIFFGDEILFGLSSLNSHFSFKLSNLKYETEKPVKPALGCAPVPVAPSSLISPPDPVAAPSKGETAVG